MNIRQIKEKRIIPGIKRKNFFKASLSCRIISQNPLNGAFGFECRNICILELQRRFGL
jgi:hypothetical protein